MGIKNAVKRVANKAAGSVSKLASLSSEELQKIEDKRNDYLYEMPQADDEYAEEFTNRLLATSAIEIYNAYLPQIKNLYVPVKSEEEYETNFNPGHNVRFINITKWVTDKEENSLEKLVNVYEVLSNEQCNISLVFNRKVNTTNVYLAVTNTQNDDNNTNIDIYKRRLVEAIKGNFPGSEFTDDGFGAIPCLDQSKSYSVASASNLPAEKSEKFISQTIEKLLDGIVPNNTSEEYTIILLATPILDVNERKLRLAELYTALTPFASWQTDYHFNDSSSFGSNATVGVNLGASVGSQQGQNQTSGITDSTSNSETMTNTETKTDSTTTSKTTTKGKNITAGASVGGNTEFSFFGLFKAGANLTTNISTGKFSSVANGVSKTVSNAYSTAKSVGKTVSHGITKTAGTFSSSSLGANFGANFARASSVTATVGKNEGITQTHVNFTIKHTLDLLEKQMERYEQSVALGMWDFAAYVLSEDVNIANNVAHSYVALTQGEDSYMSQASINLWRGDLGDESLDAKEICKYLYDLRHPVFGLNPKIPELYPIYYVYPPIVNATTALSGKELAYSLNFPRKSIAGLPIIECAEFGRNITTYDKQEDSKCINLGNIFHMNRSEDTKVRLDLNSLASHTFITGSTGAGKTNTVCRLLNEAKRQEVKILVIEPAKGEYKDKFSNSYDVNVYGTNPKITPLLKLNPFSFPEDIHILEHLDRLVEIFNVCWPMYAAMPAVLKNAIEKSYEDCGWNLLDSTNRYDDHYYPTFNDVERNIKTIIDSSEYDVENKGAYKGSLITRLHSLSNGINGMIFGVDELSNEQLFNENVILDLSRVGSNETKSLLMGIIVLKLQEYRMSTVSNYNSNLKHITVLEEAHNLLKRTSTEQSQDSGNLAGKSVEMIANSIAEMRTYGEGFIIADQAPGLLDMAVIRNTNTKIIMRLPDFSDRELVGRAANLNENQIVELAKLPVGVAAIYQNNWIQPVLCKVNASHLKLRKYQYNTESEQIEQIQKYDNTIALEIATTLNKKEQITDQLILKDIKDKLGKIQISDSIKVGILDWINNPPKNPNMEKMAPLMNELFPEVGKSIENSISTSNDLKEWTIEASNALNVEISNRQLKVNIIHCILIYHLTQIHNEKPKLEKWVEGGYYKWA